jgi:dTDP-glucose pyrophosphorylase
MRKLDQLWRKSIMSPKSTIGEVVKNLQENSVKIVLIANKLGVLKGTICDGDIRRALLKGLIMESPIDAVIQTNAFAVLPDMDKELVSQLMTANKIQQIPIVDENHHIVGLYLWDEVSISQTRANTMVIMAGGMGVRLRPETDNMPKPLVRIGSKPMLEHIIDRAKLEGFKKFIISVHYLGHMIKEYFGNGEGFGVEIEYISEDLPLGTAGALSLISDIPSEPFVVTNGDVITDIKYGEMIDFHLRYSAIASMAVKSHEWKHPFGVVKIDGLDITGFEEKPVARTNINAGVYVLDPDALKILKHNERADMPYLFQNLKLNGYRTIAYPMHEPWLDVGRPDDLVQATKENKK